MASEARNDPAAPSATAPARPDDHGANSSPTMRRVAWVLRTLILLSGVYQTIWGETVIGILTLICLAIIVAPAFFTRGLVSFFPIEVEIVLFIMVMVQFVLGEARDLYTTIPYYDKFVHFSIPALIGYIGFLLAYAMVATGKLIARMSVILGVIILMSLGAGAFEEICEYASDMILYPRIPGWHHFQGNAQEDPYYDTMNDLVADFLGAIFGASMGYWLIGRSARRQSERLPEMVDELQTMFRKPGEEARAS